MPRLRLAALVFLLIIMMWSNLFKNVRNWVERDQVPQSLLGIGSAWWLLTIRVLLSAALLVAIVRHRRGRLALSAPGHFGRAQLLFLIILWVPTIGALTQAFPAMAGRGVFLVHVSFWIAAGVCSLITVSLSSEPEPGPAEPWPASDVSWRPGLRLLALLCFIPLIILAVAAMTVASHDGPLSGSHVRFGGTSTGP